MGRESRSKATKARAHSARPLAAAKFGGARLLCVSARRRRRRGGARRHRRSLPQGPTLSRLSGKGERHRGHQLQRGRGTIRVPGGHRLSCRRHAPGRLRQPDAVRRVPPECGADIFARRLGRDQRESARGGAARLAAQGLPRHSGRPRRRRAECHRRRDAARQRLRSLPAALERRMRRQRRACRDVSRRIVRGAAPVPALRAAAIRPRRRVVSRPGRGSAVGGRAPAMAGRARDRQSRSSRIATRSPPRRRCRARSHFATARASRMSPPRSIRCCRARRSRSGASPGRTTSARLVIGLSDFIAEPDVERLDNALFRRAETLARRTPDATEAPAEVEPAPAARGSQRIEFRCTSLPAPADRGVSLEGRLFVVGRSVSRGAIDRLEIDGQPPLRDLDLDARRSRRAGRRRAAVLTPLRGRLHARGADGNALERIELRWGDRDGTASVVVLDDFAAARNAIDALGARQPRGQVRRFRRPGISPRAPDAGDAEPPGYGGRGVVLPRRFRNAARTGRAHRQSRAARRRGSQVRHGRVACGFLSLLRGMPSAAPSGRRRISCSETPTRWRPRSGTARRASSFASACGTARRRPGRRLRCRPRSRCAASSSRTPHGATAARCRASSLSVSERLRAEAGGAQGGDALLRAELREPARVPAGRCRGEAAGASVASDARRGTRATHGNARPVRGIHEPTQRCATGCEVAPPLSRSLSC